MRTVTLLGRHWLLDDCRTVSNFACLCWSFTSQYSDSGTWKLGSLESLGSRGVSQVVTYPAGLSASKKHSHLKGLFSNSGFLPSLAA